jgi:hypothetical protein
MMVITGSRVVAVACSSIVNHATFARALALQVA